MQIMFLGFCYSVMNYKIVLELDYHFDQHFHDLHFISLHQFLYSNAMYGATNRTLQELEEHLNPATAAHW